MTLSITRSRLASILAALVLTLGVGGIARAAEPTNPVDVAARIAAMAEKVAAAQAKITTRQNEGIAKIQQLDQANAPNARIAGAGRIAVRSIEEAAQTGRRAVNTIAEATIRQLRRQKAPQSSIDQVKAAREADVQAITQSATTAKAAVRAAVQAATGSGGGV